MRCRLFIFFVLIANTAQTQTHKIDSIRKNLSTLNVRDAVNSLNALGWQFFYYWIHSDSALKYANLARQKASAINYYSGEAKVMICHQPAGKMEEYFKKLSEGAARTMSEEERDNLRKEHGFERVGPPLTYLKQ